MESESSFRAESTKNVLAAFILLFSALSWFTLTASYLRLSDSSGAADAWIHWLPRVLFYISIFVSSIAGSIIGKRINRKRFLLYWTLGGAIACLVPATLTSPDIWQLLAISVLLGSAFGVGMPSCLALFAESVRIENRGVLSGGIFLTSNLAIAMLSIGLGGVEPALLILIAGIWRAIGFVAFFLLKTTAEASARARRLTTPFPALQNRRFLLYFFPWLAFCLVDFFENPIRTALFDTFAPLAGVMSLVFGSVSAILGGFFSDRIGRKPVVLYGFVSIGIAYAVLTIAPESTLALYFYASIDGIAWGILTSVFILTLWGDLSQPLEREEYYAIGNTPFFLAATIELAAKPYASFIREETAFSLAAFFLFLAVLPLLYAPETLPEKKIKERELKGYLEKARRLKEKHV